MENFVIKDILLLFLGLPFYVLHFGISGLVRLLVLVGLILVILVFPL